VRDARWWASRPGAIAALVLLVLVIILVAVTLDDDNSAAPPGPNPADHAVSAPLAGREAAQFELLTGAASVTVRTQDLGTDLYRISTPLDSGLFPKTVDHDGRVELHLITSGPPGPSAVDIQLNSSVRWALRIAAGATQQTLDFSAGKVSGVDIAVGVTRIDLSLPRPQGTVPVRLTGGASELAIHTPSGVPTRVTAGSGAGTISLNGVQRSGVPAGTVLATGGWDTATDRYDVQLSSGVATVTVDSRRP
jgi:hypothetical protein